MFSNRLRFTNKEMRATILGKLVWKRCMHCDASGFENWNDEGEDIRPGHSSDRERDTGECENCEGVGFVIAQDNT